MNKKVAVIFGGTGGIGSACVEALLNDGFHVCSIGRKKKESETLVNNKSLSHYYADLNNRDEIAVLIAGILETHKTIDCVVYSVSLPIENKNILDLEWKDFEDHINIHVRPLFWIIKILKDHIKANNKIKFVLVLSEICIGKPSASTSHYATSKYTLLGMAKCMAVDLAKWKCTINMVSPGMVDTKLLSKLPPKLIEITSDQNPLKRIANPEDVANVISFLASSKSDYLNGVNIPVNGGGVMV